MSASITPSLSANATPKTWTWKGFPICYQSAGETGPAIVFIHGFGASWGHWRKNIPVLAQTCRCYAIDLIGFGGSAKPTPGIEIDYIFETWGEQVADFCREVVGGSTFLVGNSIGCIVAMQAAVDNPDLILGVALLNFTLRQLHERKRGQLFWYESIGTSILQELLGNKWLGSLFFSQVAQPQTVRRILRQAYCRQEAVTDELIDMILKPAKEKGAAEVFIAFTRYSQGPLPEDLLPILSCPALVIWGEDDPWESIVLGRKIADCPTVEAFIPLKGVGHCPQDEAPELVNPILQNWILSKNGRKDGE
ncbi:alpha/beta fold hydrolase [Candidatus Gracilibacteria bacterium]|nr:alpha/beta fold hydrolase [Candidatus Gracilibacteria bacterium]